MKFPHVTTLLLLSIVLLPTSRSLAAQLQIDANGQLIGALGVEVFGELYDVLFEDGTCAEVFNGCDDLSDFTFVGDASNLLEPSLALRDQVLLNIAEGSFDTNPSLTNGCITDDLCSIQTPTSFLDNGFIGGTAYVNSIESANMFGWGISGSGPTFDSSFFNVTWARWSLSATPVPVPAALILFISSLGIVFGNKLGEFRR